MHEPEKSDSVVVAGKPANKAERFAAEPVEPRACPREGGGRGQGERGPTKHAPGAGPGQRVTGVGTRTASRKARKEGEVHLTPAPCRSRHTENGVLRDEAGRCARRGRLDVGDLRRGSRSTYRGPARAGQKGSVPGVTVPSELHSEGRRQSAPACSRCSRGQDRPESNGRSAERDLRGGFTRVLVWVSAEAQPARCAGRADRRDQQQEGEL